MKEYEVVIRLLIAIIIGGLIGYERESQNRPAGFRTHILVCIGAAVISMIQLYSIDETTALILKHPELASALKADIGRLGAQVVTGVGFLGAGTIIHQRGSVKGLTTAASLWVVACIGLAVGLGYYFLSIMSAFGVVIVLVSLKKFEARFLDKTIDLRVEIKTKDKKGLLQQVGSFVIRKGISIKNIEFIPNDEVEGVLYVTSLYTFAIPKHISQNEILDELYQLDAVLKVEML